MMTLLLLFARQADGPVLQGRVLFAIPKTFLTGPALAYVLGPNTNASRHFFLTLFSLCRSKTSGLS